MDHRTKYNLKQKIFSNRKYEMVYFQCWDRQKIFIKTQKGLTIKNNNFRCCC